MKIIELPIKFKENVVNRYGEKVFESSQFIRSELSNSSLDNIDLIVTKISKKIKEDKKLIYKALYIYLTSKVIYHIKVKHNEGKIKKILRYVKS